MVLFGLVVDVVASRCQRLTDLTVTNEFALLKGNDAVEVGVVPVSEVEDNFSGILWSIPYSLQYLTISLHLYSIILLLLPGTCWQQFFFLVSIVVFLFKDILVLLGSSVAREHCSFIQVASTASIAIAKLRVQRSLATSSTLASAPPKFQLSLYVLTILA